MSPSGTPGLGRSGRNVPVRNTRPRDHDTNPDPRFLPPFPRRSLAKNHQKLLLTAPEGAGGSKLLLLDKRCDSAVDLREWRLAEQAGGRDVSTGQSRSVGSSTYSTGSNAA